ncbi:MAG: hypothetical protein Q4F95_15840 [Oscillospiraceae bacterium]|nr:hypothetical protein [Oscillospiraceae bacterium]
MKKFLAVIFLLIIVLTSGAFTIWKLRADITVESADFSVTIDTGTSPSAYCMCADGSMMPYEYSNSGYLCIDKNLYGHINHMTFEGEPVYCIGRHTQRSPGSTTTVDKCSDIPLDSPEYAAVFSAANAGASHMKGIYGLSEYDMYYVTACALRSIVYGISPDSAAFYDTNHNYNEAMTNEYRHLLECSAQPVRQTSSKIRFNTDGICAVQVTADDKCYYRYGPYNPEADEPADNTYNLSVSVPDSVCFISCDPEAHNSSSCTSYNFGDSFYVYINASYTDNVSISVKAALNTTDYYPVVYLAADSSYQNIARLSVSENTVTNETQLVLSNSNTCGDLRITKKFMDNGESITEPGLSDEPRFTIQTADNLYVAGTFEDGVLTYESYTPFKTEYGLNTQSNDLIVKNLPVGEYIINESKGAEGYVAEIDTISVCNTAFEDEVVFINNAIHEETTTVCTTDITQLTSPTELTSETTLTSEQTTQLTTINTDTPSQSQVSAASSTPVCIKMMPGSPKTADKDCIPTILCLLLSLLVILISTHPVKK